MTSSRMSQTTGVPVFDFFFAALMVVAMPMPSRREDEGFEEFQRHQLLAGRTGAAGVGPTVITERPE